MSWTARQIAELVEGRLVGASEAIVSSMETPEAARPDQLTFIGDERYARGWPQSRATAAIAAEGLDLEPGEGRALIVVSDVDLAVAALLREMAPPQPEPEPGVHPAATVDPSARLGEGVRIAAQAFVGAGARLGDGAVLHPGAVVLNDCVLGEGCVLWPGAVVRERCRLGDRCVLQPNATLGAEGFGYRPDPDNGGGPVRIPQIGTVTLGDDVEVGAGACIDRAKFSATEIGSGAKLDNLVQIAHNCRIGRHTIIAGCCAIAGSVTIGDYAVLGGAVQIRDHVTIGERARIAGGSAVMNDVPAGETWGGYPAREHRRAAREHAALRKLPEVLRSMRKG
jgi:UDP-3-O-[3-hydroxymyristoyl] glucosamine N-acyltransferase